MKWKADLSAKIFVNFSVLFLVIISVATLPSIVRNLRYFVRKSGKCEEN